MAKELHSEMLFVRVTPKELAAARRAAKAAGFASVSEWFRVTLKNMLRPLDNV